MGRCCFEDYKPTLAMAALQFVYAGVSLLGKAAFTEGMNPRVFVVYRQAIAALALAPAAYFSHSNQKVLGRSSLWMVFMAALLGITINQNLYFLGLYFGSTSMATAMSNLVPAITFLMAVPLGLEKVSIRSSRGIAKVAGTIICVGGAITMALLKGPKLLLHMRLQPSSSLFHTVGDQWMLGCLLLLVPINRSFPDPLSMSAWMWFFAFLQSAILTFFLEPDRRAWRLDSILQIICCICAGVAGSSVTICVQAWCISRRGPLFSAMFRPLCTVIATIMAFIILHEELHLGSVAGAAAVIIGLYVVLWGKADELNSKKDQNPENYTRKVAVTVDDTAWRCKSGIGEPLLVEKPQDVERNDMEN